MKRLVRLLLINWYRLEQVGIEIKGHTAFIGPNASGKSSILDAIQAVLVGGDKRWWNPNASAGEKSTRSLRDYCLGVVRDPNNPDLSKEFRPRDQAMTYLVMAFREDSGESISKGLALHARLEEPQESIDGRFIAPGLELILSDLVDRTSDGVVPKPWKRLREELRMRAGEDFRVHSQVGEYQRHICAALSDGKRHLDAPRFLRAFKNAITFAPIRNVSDFVRNHILEERQIQVRSLQQALQHYRDIQTRTREARKREDELAAIDKHCRRTERAKQLEMAWRWVEQEAAYNALEAELDPLRETIENKEKQITVLEERIKELQEHWDNVDAALTEASNHLAATDVVQQQARIKAERKSARQSLSYIEMDLNTARQGLGRVHQVLDYTDYLQDEELVAALRRLPQLITQEEGLLASPWPTALADVMEAISNMSSLLNAAVESMRERYENLVREEGELKRALEEIRVRISRLESGGSDLQQATVRLINLLEEHGIEAVPLCDRVDVADEDWRDALEAFLGGHREALLVAPEQVRDAIVLYRREGKRMGIYGSRIINTLKTKQWLNRRSPGSLAEMVESDDQHAIAYINLRAGNVLRVESEDELVGHDRAITADGMLATGGAVLRLRPEEAMLGREAKQKTLESLEQRFVDEGKAHYNKREGIKSAARLREELVMPLVQHIRVFPDLNVLTKERKMINEELIRLDDEEKSILNDKDYQLLVELEARCRDERNAINAEREKKSIQNNELMTTIAGGDRDDRLEDYRQYFHFDVRMSDDKEGKGNPEFLSRRLSKGSGGEHQSPFYVAIGAALAAAYRIKRNENGAFRGGMGMAVFDEAFSKLDLQNTVSALGFLDELGLEVLLAAPDERYGMIAEHVDTIVNVYRDGANVHIDAEYIKPAARRILASDNPVSRANA